jgi:uncharacterized membrane protein
MEHFLNPIPHNVLNPGYILPNLCGFAVLGYVVGLIARFFLRRKEGARPAIYKLVAYSVVPGLFLVMALQLKAYIELGFLSADFVLTYCYTMAYWYGQWVGLQPGDNPNY